MPGTLPPDQLTVQDGLVFVNCERRPAAMVINGTGQWKPVTKYTTLPPPPEAATLPSPDAGPADDPRRTGPAHRPAEAARRPVNPRALAGNGMATVSWGAAPDNGSPDHALPAELDRQRLVRN